MSFTYTWRIDRIAKKSSGTIQDAIVQTFWNVTGTDSDGNSATFNGATPFDISTVDPNNFVNYDDLDEEVVLSWVKNVVNSDPTYKAHIDMRIAKEIEETAQPTNELTSGFPWQDGEEQVTPTPPDEDPPSDSGGP